MSILPEVGQKRSSSVIYLTEMVEKFAEISGDKNPVHLDFEFASKSIFKNKIVHGILVSSQISALIANELPGPGSIYLNQELKFVSPVYHGDEIICVVEVIEIIEAKSIVILSTICKQTDGKEVIIGKATIKKV